MFNIEHKVHWQTLRLSKEPRTMDRASFIIEAMIRGYHIYRDIWSAILEELPCQRETDKSLTPLL